MHIHNTKNIYDGWVDQNLTQMTIVNPSTVWISMSFAALNRSFSAR